jgi:hypothetical protein
MKHTSLHGTTHTSIRIVKNQQKYKEYETPHVNILARLRFCCMALAVRVLSRCGSKVLQLVLWGGFAPIPCNR